MIRRVQSPGRRGTLLLGAASLVALMAMPIRAAQINFDNSSTDGTWETATNWSTDTLPTSTDQPVINPIATNSPATVGLTSAQTVAEAVVSWPNGGGGAVAGTSTLNIGAGTTLTVLGTVTSGFRVGRAVAAGQLVGSSQGVVNQTGGAVTIAATNGLRLSQDAAGVLPDSLYAISGGSVRAGSGADGTMTGNLQIGRADADYNRAEFRVVGSAATSIRFVDIIDLPSTLVAATGTRNTVMSFQLDAGGVTPVVAEDEMRFSGVGNHQLDISLLAAPPLSDITLITADRLNTANSPPAGETFDGMPNGTPIVRTFGGFNYAYNLLYQDGSDDGVLDAFVKLQFVSVTPVPEPSSLGLLGVAGLALLRRRQRA
jgi:hypothetical protein